MTSRWRSDAWLITRAYTFFFSPELALRRKSESGVDEATLVLVPKRFIAVSPVRGGFGQEIQTFGQVLIIFVITIAAAELALAIAIILRIYRNKNSVNVDEMNILKG